MKHSRIIWLGAFVFALLCGAPLAKRLAHAQDREVTVRPRTTAAPKRMALVIGNGKYSTAPLPNAPNDAQQIAAVLRKLNFEVVELSDQSQKEMKQAIRAFGENLSKTAEGSVAWFFYAGHGVQVNGRNYLVPIGADVTNEVEAEDECVNVELVLAQMARTRNALNIVVLDACRNNPFRGWRSGGDGLAFINAPSGTLIAYATSPGRTAADGTGKNSPYTAALLKQLPRANVNLLRMFELVREEVEMATRGNQTPWESTSVKNGSEFYLAGGAAAPRQSQLVDPRQIELEFWNSVKTSPNPSELRTYLTKFPNGEFRALAENRLAELTRGPSVTGVPLRSFDYQTLTVDAYGRSSPKRTGQAWGFTENINGAALEMVEIEGDTFTMGSPTTEKDRDADEGPQRQVTVSGFTIGKYEVTQAQWQAVTKLPKVKIDLPADPANYKGANLPVERVSWYEAVEFCARLSKLTGRTYRLPTEAEWEYAARAKTTTAFAFGATISPHIVNYAGNAPYGNASEGENRGKIVAVGSLGVANAFGLYDLHGNVYEWCEDEWSDSYRGTPTDGSARPGSGISDRRVLRGGSWLNDGKYCRSANRDWNVPDAHDNIVGFRVVAVSKIR